MFASIAVAALAFLPAALGQAALQVESPPSLVTCQPAALSWSGGTAPYYPSIIPGGQPGATALENFPVQQGTTYTWTAVNIAANTQITIQVRDSSGAVQYSSPITIAAGPDTSCVGQSLSSGSSSTAAAASDSSASTESTMSAMTTSTMMSMSSASATSATSAATSDSVASKASSVASKASSVAGSVAASGSSAAASASASATKSGAASNFQAGVSTIAGLAGLLGLAYLL